VVGENFITRRFITYTAKMGRAYSTHGSEDDAYMVLVGNPEGIRSSRRQRCKWEDNIKRDPREKRWSGMDWICLAQIRDQTQAVVNMVMTGAP
jgi:hypothetical protein